MQSGLLPVKPNRKDYSLLHTFGNITPPPESLPPIFSIYDGRPIPNQDEVDTRFTPNIPPLPMGCTAESGSFESGLQDVKLYDPEDLYKNTPPFDSGGRQIRDMLQVLIDRGVKDIDGVLSPKRLAYFNCYGSGAIDDFDAARIALWINQSERRGVYVGSYWYWGVPQNAQLPIPSFSIMDASLHCYVVTGWSDPDTLEVIPWVGMIAGDKGKFQMSRVLYNALMAQPWTGAFTITKVPSGTPIPIGYIAVIDHLEYFIRQLFRV